MHYRYRCQQHCPVRATAMSRADGGTRPSASSKRQSGAGAPNGWSRQPSMSNVNEAELDPSDSASNAPARRPGLSSTQQRSTTTARTSNYDRQTERAQVTTRHTVQIRTRSPSKVAINGSFDMENARYKDIPRSSVERKRAIEKSVPWQNASGRS